MEENKKFIIAALVVMLGSNTSGILNAVNPNVRADAFTSLDAAIMKEEIMDEVRVMKGACEMTMHNIENSVHVMNNRVTTNEFRITDCLKRIIK